MYYNSTPCYRLNDETHHTTDDSSDSDTSSDALAADTADDDSASNPTDLDEALLPDDEEPCSDPSLLCSRDGIDCGFDRGDPDLDSEWQAYDTGI